MVYCFISELVSLVEKDDPYWIQRQYAIRLGRYVEYSFENQRFYDDVGRIIVPPIDRILWVGDCLYSDRMDEATELYGLNSVDTYDTREKITKWYKNGWTERKIYSKKKKEILEYIKKKERVFVKTEKKGWGTVVDNNTICLIEKTDKDETFVVSEYREIKEDEYGKIEIRFIVLDGRIINASRYVHSIKHIVDEDSFCFACNVVERINEQIEFPNSYVLDIALFKNNLGIYGYDIVELNSISTSLCYINNSIFCEAVPEIESIHNKTGWGFEYCYDYLQNNDKYYFESGDLTGFVYRRL